ncbi:YhdH/YhfP family quinone oxidoreductase [Geomonas subterranea]|uniref:YhdH/YhfP family quinone oxidoreductase n=1 Tax=Geomonas subterranea TaxID=2847989 RepID=UPI001CD1E86C|nr:YhdH/YhfP family quinone oxidoreductase [Geomonas fuzhouensis]
MQTRTSFKALVVEKGGDQTFTRSIKERDINELDAGELLVRVRYSSLNYKDALSATGHPGVTRQFPHTPGIDAAGEVVSCSDGSFTPGDQVLVTGHDLGMETDGGWGEYIRVPSSWGVPLPSGLSLRESMILGTAGFTAGLSVLKLERAGVRQESGDILVTGATGGVGTLAVSILAKAGYRVVAATGKMGDVPFLTEMGAAEVISREEVTAGGERPLMKERWAGAVDVVGGETLAAVLKSTRYGGTVTCCGLVGSADLPVNVHPFILRAVTLVGIDSSRCPTPTRLEVWQRLAGAWRPAFLEQMATEVTLEGLEEKIGSILRGGVRGRVLVRL